MKVFCEIESQSAAGWAQKPAGLPLSFTSLGSSPAVPNEVVALAYFFAFLALRLAAFFLAPPLRFFAAIVFPLCTGRCTGQSNAITRERTYHGFNHWCSKSLTPLHLGNNGEPFQSWFHPPRRHGTAIQVSRRRNRARPIELMQQNLRNPQIIEGKSMSTRAQRLAGTTVAILAGAGLMASASAAELSGAGATFPYPIYAKWAEAYKAATGIGLNYQSIGSGGGIKQIEAKTVDFGASDMPLEARRPGEERAPAIPAGDRRRGHGGEHPGRHRRPDDARRSRPSPTSISARSPSGTTRRSPSSIRA